MCASPRAGTLLRSLPPDLSASYARGHDDAAWRCLLALLGEEAYAGPEVAAARRLVLLPAGLGRLGLQCAERTAPAAYWAACTDALPVLRARRPDASARCLAELAAGPAAAAACFRAAAEAGCVLDGAGWQGRPSSHDVHNGVRPAHCDLPEPGERCQGWHSGLSELWGRCSTVCRPPVLTRTPLSGDPISRNMDFMDPTVLASFAKTKLQKSGRPVAFSGFIFFGDWFGCFAVRPFQC